MSDKPGPPPFMPIRKPQAAAALMIALAASFLFCGYEFVRSASNTLFKEAYGKEALPTVMAIMPLGVLAILYLYGRMLSWLGPRRTLLATTLLSSLTIAAATLGARAGHAPATGVLYVFREAYVVLLMAQYWSFINSTLGESEARRLNGPILGVGSIGPIIGGLLVSRYAPTLGTMAMPLFGAAALLLSAILSDIAYRIVGEPRPAPQGLDVTPSENASRGGIGLRVLARSRMLTLLLGVVLLTQVVSTSLDLRFQGALSDAFPHQPDAQTAYSGWFFSMISLAAAVLQFGVAPLLLRGVPLLAVHLAIPCIHLAAGAALLAWPSLATAGLAFLLFKSLDYSLFQAAKEILYIPLSFDARYRAKELIDVFGYRLGKGGISLIYALAQRGSAVSGSVYSLVTAVAVGVWALLVLPLMQARKHAHKPRLFPPSPSGRGPG